MTIWSSPQSYKYRNTIQQSLKTQPSLTWLICLKFCLYLPAFSAAPLEAHRPPQVAVTPHYFTLQSNRSCHQSNGPTSQIIPVLQLPPQRDRVSTFFWYKSELLQHFHRAYDHFLSAEEPQLPKTGEWKQWSQSSKRKQFPFALCWPCSHSFICSLRCTRAVAPWPVYTITAL